MAGPQFSLNANARGRGIRTAPAKFLTSKLRPNIEQNEGVRPPEPVLPNRYLPVRFIDVETAEGVVIPLGTIVSFESMTTPDASGSIYVGQNMLDANNAVQANIDDSYYGYPDPICQLVTIANGGTDVAGNHTLEDYSSLDVQVGTMKNDGTLAADGDASPGRSANYPVGVAMADIYQDIRGKYLNYDGVFRLADAVLCDYYISVPFYIQNDDDDVAFNDESDAGYALVVNEHAYLYQYTGKTLAVGQLLKSDMFGKFIPQHGAISSGNDVEYKTAQTVGRLFALDCRYPKQMLDVVDTYPGSQMPGTDTGGLPYALFNFLYALYGGNKTLAEMLHTVRKGYAGTARIQLLAS